MMILLNNKVGNEKYPDERQNLEILAEECAEVIHIKSKVIRFGIDDYHPKNGYPNRDALGRECGHLLRMVDVLISNGTIRQDDVESGYHEKGVNLDIWYRRETENNGGEA